VPISAKKIDEFVSHVDNWFILHMYKHYKVGLSRLDTIHLRDRLTRLGLFYRQNTRALQ
jgi:hypothetical protein